MNRNTGAVQILMIGWIVDKLWNLIKSHLQIQNQHKHQKLKNQEPSK